MPTSVLLSVGILGPIFLILIIDLAVIKKSRGETGQTIQNFTFGFFVNLLFTEMTKYTIGRLRYVLINYTRVENYYLVLRMENWYLSLCASRQFYIGVNLIGVNLI